MCFLLCHTYCILGGGLWLIACICHKNVNRKYVSSRISDTVWDAFLIQESFPNCELDTMFHRLPHSSVDSIFQCGQSQKKNLTRLTIFVCFYFIVTGTILGKRAFCKQLRVLQGGVQVCFEVDGANTNGSSESHEKIVQVTGGSRWNACGPKCVTLWLETSTMNTRK